MGLSELSFSATNINVGLDADKPINPRQGDIYVANDTKRVLVCYDAGVWTDANSVMRGVEADLPASPTLGMKYICTDVRRIYECLRPGEWVMTHKGNINWGFRILEDLTKFIPTSSSYVLSHKVTIPAGECLQEFGAVVSYSCDDSENLKFYVAVNGNRVSAGPSQYVDQFVRSQRAGFSVWAEGGDEIQVYTALVLSPSQGGQVTALEVFQ